MIGATVISFDLLSTPLRCQGWERRSAVAAAARHTIFPFPARGSDRGLLPAAHAPLVDAVD